MYLEERIEQLEHVTADHGRQIETVAQGLADLTVDVRAIRQDMTAGFRQIDARLDKMDARLDKMDGRLDIMDGTLQLIVKLLTDKHS